MNKERILECLKTSKAYRGQVFWERSVSEIRPAFFSLDGFPDDLKNLTKQTLETFGIQALYSHQGELIDGLRQGRDVILLASEGSGKSTIIEIAAIVLSILNKKSTLFIKSKAGDLTARKNSIISKLSRVRWKTELWPLLTDFFDMTEASPEQLIDIFLSETNILYREILLSNLGLIVIEDVTSFEPGEIAHLKNMIRAINIHSDRSVRFLLTGSPIQSPHKLADDLIGRNALVISSDGAPKSPYSFIAWIPPLESKKGLEGKSLEIARRFYLDELGMICQEILKTGEVNNLLIWHAFANISSEEISRIQEKAVREIAKKDIPFSNLKITEINSPADMPKTDFRKIDACLVLGVPRELSSLQDLLGNITRPNGLVIIVAPEDPLTFHFLRDPKTLDGAYGLPELIVPQSRNVLKEYIVRLLLSSPALQLKSSYFEHDKHYDEIVAKLSENKAVSINDGIIAPGDYDLLAKNITNLPWGALSPSYLTVVREETRFKIIDEAIVPHVYFIGGIAYHDNQKYIIEKIEKSKIVLRAAPEKSHVLRHPIISIEIGPIESVDDRKETPFGPIEKLCLSINAKLLGYKYYEDYSFLANMNKGTASVLYEKPEHEKTTKSPALRLGTTNPHAMEHLLKIFLPIFFKDSKSYIFTARDQGHVYIAACSEETAAIITYIYDHWEMLSKLLMEFGYHLLIKCPCGPGCPLCIQVYDCHEEKISSKKELILEIADKIGKSEEAETLLRFRESGLSGLQADSIYRIWRDRILDIFSKKFTLTIRSKANLKGMETCSSPNARGTYKGDIVEIKYGLPEADAVEVIAHEYAHNWEFDPPDGNINSELTGGSIPYGGKLVSEGFADWIAYKVLDFFGLVDYMKGIDLREGDEYGDGFDLISHIERQIGGFYGVIDFLKTAKCRDPETGIEFNFQQILEASGLREKLNLSK